MKNPTPLPCLLLTLYLGTALGLPATVQGDWLLTSPDGALSTRLFLDETGQARFQVYRQGEALIRPSPLGIRLDSADFTKNLAVFEGPDESEVADCYRLPSGKQHDIEYHAGQLRVGLKNGRGQPVWLTLRLSNDGLAYRYEFSGAADVHRRVAAESGGVHFFAGTRAWLQPKANVKTGWKKTNPSYEEDYLQDIPVGTPSPTKSGWVYPALFRYGSNWILLSETGMDGRYPASNLASRCEDGLYTVRFPQEGESIVAGGVLPALTGPFQTPWRLVLFGDLATITESTLGTDLALPSVLENTAFVQPGISAWSWGLLKDDFTVYPVQKQFVDYAAEMNWPYVLVDADWDQKIGYERIRELADYAAEKKVSLLLWYNSSGDWNETTYSPKSRLLTRDDRRAEFTRLQEMGIRGIKVDFFAGDGASVVQYYQDILQDAADFGLVVNTHGSTLPRGLQRTYPNYLTSEAVKGLEFITFEQANADREATHSAMLPFTRNVFDPMDFTPMVLGAIPDIERRTSNGFQLALPVLFTSGIQHLVTTPEQMAEMPEFVRAYLRNLPARWDESRLVDGFPGRYVVMARRAGYRWFVAGINAEPETKTLRPDLAFTGLSHGTLITDGASWRKPAKSSFQVGKTEITLPHGTGFILILEP